MNTIRTVEGEYQSKAAPAVLCADRTRARGVRVIAAMILLSGSYCLAQSDLIRLIPPNAPVIAGMRRVHPDQAKDALWLATKNNADDVGRFVALTDGDSERRINHVIVADWASTTDNLGNHLLLAQGRFNLINTGLTALNAGATRLIYKGVPVLAVEAGTGGKPGTRWLAMPRSEFAVFGTPEAVQTALDRFRSGAAADPQLVERLKNEHEEDAAWSSVRLDSRYLQARVKLGGDEDAMLRCLGQIHELDLGIRMGATVKIDLHTGPAAADDGAGASVGCLASAFFGNGSPRKHVVVYGDDETHLRVSLGRDQYDRWLDVFRKSRTNQMLEAMMGAPANEGSQSTAGGQEAGTLTQ